jgi:hypothetical protein
MPWHDTCRGTLPATLAQLSNLQWMLLDNNQLTGSLPAFLGQMPSLKRVLLQNNRFAGPVPSSWCAGNATFDVSNNQNLCGEQLAAASGRYKCKHSRQAGLCSVVKFCGSLVGNCTSPSCPPCPQLMCYR